MGTRQGQTPRFHCVSQGGWHGFCGWDFTPISGRLGGVGFLQLLMVVASENSKFGAVDTRNCVCPCDLNSFLLLLFLRFEKKNILGGRKENSTSCFALGLICGLGYKKRKKMIGESRKQLEYRKLGKSNWEEINLGGMLGVTAHNMILLLYERGFFIRPLIRGLVL